MQATSASRSEHLPPTFDSQVARMAAAERGDGWMVACEEAGRFLVLSRELIAALAEAFREVGPAPVLEIAAGRGELSRSLRGAGVPVTPTDADPPVGSPVERATAAEALERYRPAVVLGSFAPVDSGVDAAVMRCPSVRHYFVLSARIGGLLGSPELWNDGRWAAQPLDEVGRWMLTRYDVWLGGPGRRVLRHGEAWRLDNRSTHGPAASGEAL